MLPSFTSVPPILPSTTAWWYLSIAVRIVRSSLRSSISRVLVRVTRAMGRMAEARISRMAAVATISR